MSKAMLRNRQISIVVKQVNDDPNSNCENTCGE